MCLSRWLQACADRLARELDAQDSHSRELVSATVDANERRDERVNITNAALQATPTDPTKFVTKKSKMLSKTATGSSQVRSARTTAKFSVFTVLIRICSGKFCG